MPHRAPSKPLTLEQVTANDNYRALLRDLVRGKYYVRSVFCPKLFAAGLLTSQWAGSEKDFTPTGRRAAALSGAFD